MHVSVVIPAHNASAFIQETIASVLANQSHVCEIIVADDGSTDSTAGLALGMSDLVRVHRQQQAGASVARNAAVVKASGAFVAFLDADDLWHANKLGDQLAYLQAHPDAGAVASSFVTFGDGRPETLMTIEDHVLRGYRSLDFLSSPRVHPSTLLVRAGLARDLRFPEGLIHGEDVVYAALLRSRTVIGSVDAPLVRQRHHATQVTKTAKHFSLGITSRLEWGVRHYQLIGAASPAAVADALFEAAAEDVMARYWARELEEFSALRAQLMRIWPANRPVPRALRRRTPPRWILRLKDAVESFTVREGVSS